MAVRADVLEIARVLEDASRAPELARFSPPPALGGDAAVYARLMPRLPRHADVPGALQSARFRPLFLINGLIHAAALSRMPRRVLLEALAAGLLEFADYFAALGGQDRPAFPVEQGAALQKRYFAYCLAQLVECGFSLTAALATMKGDALDPQTGYEVRSWIEEGPQAMLASERLTWKERELLGAVFRGGKGAWPAFRDHLVAAYQLPFRTIPERWTGPDAGRAG